MFYFSVNKTPKNKYQTPKKNKTDSQKQKIKSTSSNSKQGDLTIYISMSQNHCIFSVFLRHLQDLNQFHQPKNKVRETRLHTIPNLVLWPHKSHNINRVKNHDTKQKTRYIKKIKSCFFSYSKHPGSVSMSHQQDQNSHHQPRK